MVRHAPIHRRSDHSDIAICCGRNVRGSSLSTSVVPLSNQVTTLNHKRFKGFKMFSDGHLDATKDVTPYILRVKSEVSHGIRNFISHGIPPRWMDPEGMAAFRRLLS